MWIEGKVKAIDLIQAIKDAILSHTAWSEISSNVGTLLADDGYVFKSSGSSTTDEIYIGLKNAYHGDNAANWEYGPRLFIAEKYTPSSTQGENGTLENEIQEQLMVTPQYNYQKATEETAKIEYGVSVNADRVIIYVDNGYRHYRRRMQNVIYLGLLNRYSTERNSNGSVIAATRGVLQNSYDYIRVLKDGRLQTGQAYDVMVNDVIVGNAENGAMPSGIDFKTVTPVIGSTNEGPRGELQGLRVSQFITPAGQANLPLFGDVNIDGVKHKIIYVPYYENGYHSNISPTTGHYTLFVEKS